MARLHLDSLRPIISLAALREAVRCFPYGLNEQYSHALTSITAQGSQWRDLAQQILKWLSSAFRQLNVEELRHALAIQLGDIVIDTERLPALKVLFDSCHGLVTIAKES